MEREDRPVRNPRIAARVIAGKAIVVNVDNKQLHTLNLVGTRVWQLCEGRSLGEIASALVDEYGVSSQVALEDVDAFVRELREVGALMPREPGQ